MSTCAHQQRCAAPTRVTRINKTIRGDHFPWQCNAMVYFGPLMAFRTWLLQCLKSQNTLHFVRHTASTKGRGHCNSVCTKKPYVTSTRMKCVATGRLLSAGYNGMVWVQVLPGAWGGAEMRHKSRGIKFTVLTSQ